eukprot:SM000239S08079  [mRNA]  locus=s239:175327:178120:- [translate_table: standard]
MLGALPGLCQLAAASAGACGDLALAAVDATIGGFLAPPTWLPVLAAHLPVQAILARPSGTTAVFLRVCLTVVQSQRGLELLRDAGLLRHLTRPFHHLTAAGNKSRKWGGGDGGPSSATADAKWTLVLALVTAVLRSAADANQSANAASEAFSSGRDNVVEQALDFVAEHGSRMLGVLEPPPGSRQRQAAVPRPLGLNKRARAQQCSPLSLAALKEVEHVLMLMVELARWSGRWARRLPGLVPAFAEAAARHLAFTAQEGALWLADAPPSGSGLDLPFRSSPESAVERAGVASPAAIGSNRGWFALAAHACADLARPPLAAVNGPPLQGGAAAAAGDVLASKLAPGAVALEDLPCRPSGYSEELAMAVYKTAGCALRFTCELIMQAIGPVSGAPVDYRLLPNMPSPEILHSLQEQGIVILTELLSSSRRGPQIDEACRLLLSIVDQALLVEACIVRACGVPPSPIHTDLFIKGLQPLQAAVQKEGRLEPLLLELQTSAPLVHASLT